MRKLLTYAAVAFVVFFIVSKPTEAALAATGIGDQLGTAASALSVFLGVLLGGGQ